MGELTSNSGHASLTEAELARQVEKRSIDCVPESERYGKPSSLAPIWFVGNINITGMAAGLTGLILGGNLLWTIIATILGSLVGTFFMALHSAQGPKLGLPQMVQSRPQFGFLGAAITVWVFVIINYAGYNVFNNLLVGDSIHTLIPAISSTWGYVIATVVAGLLAIWGYALIHWSNKWIAYVMIPVLAVFTIGGLFTLDFSSGAWSLGGFKWTPFLAQFCIMAGYQLSWAVYVSDYSRYLPSGVSQRRVFWWTYWPTVISGVWVFAIGALVTDPNQSMSIVPALQAAGNSVLPGFGTVMLILGIVGLIAVMVLNMYGGALTLISFVDSFKPLHPQRWHRIVGVIAICVTSFVISLFAANNFSVWYANFLVVLLYLFTPWTAINLVDFYLVRKETYSIEDIFNPDGIYGRWGWRGIASYLIAFAAMIPFFSTTAYTGPVATALGGTDISIFIGLPVAGLVYLGLCRSLNTASEFKIAKAEEPHLHQTAATEVAQ